MDIQFTKMHALGNDFVVIDSFTQSVELTTKQIRLCADRHFGIGCDQLLLINPSDKEGVNVEYIIYNADGGKVAQCGNGARCIAAYLSRARLVKGREITAETCDGSIMTMYLSDDGQIKVNMGVPSLVPAEIPIAVGEYAEQYHLDVEGTKVSFSAVSIGNPHAVIMVDDVSAAPVSSTGEALQHQHFFPQGVNVGFMQMIDDQCIKLRVYERGVGETLACGSGACAAVVAGCASTRLNNEVDVELPGGSLHISWAGSGEPIWMTGPATFVYCGEISL